MSGKDARNVGFLSVFSVASVWFGSHAGGGFATGNQATQYFIQYGWYGPIMAILSMAILALVLREIIIMTNNHGFTNYKQVFEELFYPYTKLELLFELFNYIIALSATGAAIAGAATLFTNYGVNYVVAVIGVSILLFILTIFGAGLVAKASTLMSICILVLSGIIFFLGIKEKSSEIVNLMSTGWTTGGITPPTLKMLSYAGFQVLCAPALISCAFLVKTARNATKVSIIGFIMNALALGLSCFMLLGWYSEYSASASSMELPTLYICNQLGIPVLYYFYTISLFLCFISTGVSCIFGLVPRFENAKILSNMSINKRRMTISLIGLVLSTLVSMAGLTNIIKYAYVYSGYLSLFVVVIPVLTVGRYKNRKWIKEHKNSK